MGQLLTMRLGLFPHEDWNLVFLPGRREDRGGAEPAPASGRRYPGFRRGLGALPGRRRGASGGCPRRGRPDPRIRALPRSRGQDQGKGPGDFPDLVHGFVEVPEFVGSGRPRRGQPPDAPRRPARKRSEASTKAGISPPGVGGRFSASAGLPRRRGKSPRFQSSWGKRHEPHSQELVHLSVPARVEEAAKNRASRRRKASRRRWRWGQGARFSYSALSRSRRALTECASGHEVLPRPQGSHADLAEQIAGRAFAWSGRRGGGDDPSRVRWVVAPSRRGSEDGRHPTRDRGLATGDRRAVAGSALISREAAARATSRVPSGIRVSAGLDGNLPLSKCHVQLPRAEPENLPKVGLRSTLS